MSWVPLLRWKRANHYYFDRMVGCLVGLMIGLSFDKKFCTDGLFAFELGCVAQEQGIILQYYGLLPWVSKCQSVIFITKLKSAKNNEKIRHFFFLLKHMLRFLFLQRELQLILHIYMYIRGGAEGYNAKKCPVFGAIFYSFSLPFLKFFSQ